MLRSLVFLLLLPIWLSAQTSWEGSHEGGFFLRVSLSDTELTIEDTLKVEVVAKHPETHTVDLDELRMNLLKVVGLSEPPFALVSEEEKGDNTFIFVLEPQIAGLHFISLYDVSFVPKNEGKHQEVEIVSDIFKVEVTLPPREEEYQGMAMPLLSLSRKFPIAVTPTNRKNLLENPLKDGEEAGRNAVILRRKAIPWAEISAVLMFVFLLLIARMQPKRSPDLEKERRRRALSAKNRAVQSLDALDQLGLVEKHEFEKYYVELTDTVRRYIEEKFLLKATTQTTQEFLIAMTKNPAFDEEMRATLADFLISADQVKFAEHEPTADECDAVHHMARQFIDHSSSI